MGSAVAQAEASPRAVDWRSRTDDASGERARVYLRRPNDLLRTARLRQLSPSGSGRCMSRQELAELANAHVASQGCRGAALDATYIGKLERGEHRWPQSRYREAFRTVLRATTDSDLGFFIVRRQTA